MISDDGAKRKSRSDQELLHHLARHIEQLLADLRQTKLIEDKRLKALGSLKAVIDFLDEIRWFKEEKLTAPLVEIVAALLATEQGHFPTLFQPTNFSSRAIGPIDYLLLKAYAAAAMELYIRSGQRWRDAAWHVARCLTNAGFRLPGRDRKVPTANTLKNWRTALRGRRFDALANNSFATTVALPERTGRDPAIVADLICETTLIDQVNRILFRNARN